MKKHHSSSLTPLLLGFLIGWRMLFVVFGSWAVMCIWNAAVIKVVHVPIVNYLQSFLITLASIGMFLVWDLISGIPFKLFTGLLLRNKLKEHRSSQIDKRPIWLDVSLTIGIIIVCLLSLIALISLIVMITWNVLISKVFHLPCLTYSTAFELNLLFGLLTEQIGKMMSPTKNE
jgi:hypothetical protein